MPVEIDERHVHHTIRGMLRGIKSASLRDDLYQEAWLAVLEAAAAHDEHPEWGSWRNTAYRVSRWAILNGRRRRRERPLCEALARDARRMPSIDARLDAPVYLASLDETDRQVIAMRFRDDMTLKEIGSRMGITGEAARLRLKRILDQLRFRLAPKFERQ
jgi:RNA polymerase sigma factor (sigma-70 family)